MNIYTIEEYKSFMFFDAISELKNDNKSLLEKIQILLNMVLAFYPIIEESELIEYITYIEINLKIEDQFNLVSDYVTAYVAAGGIMLESLLERSLVQDENSSVYIDATMDEELKNKFNQMHDDISGRDLLK